MALASGGGKGTERNKTTPRRGRGFASAADTARKRLSEAAASHGFAEPEVLLRWAEVVGDSLAATSTPVKVTYPRGQGLGATLVVRAPGARAPEVEHLGPRIVERVNRFYGYRAIGRVKVTQTTAPGLAEAGAPFAGSGPSTPTPSGAGAEGPDPVAQARAAELTRDIRSDALRDALTRMGAHVLSRGPGPAKD